MRTQEKNTILSVPPECAIAIDNYLEYRQKSGEKITESSPLIRECFDKVIIHDINNNENTAIAKRKTKFLTTYGIGGILSNLMIKSEINGGITPYLKLEALGQKQRGSERKAVKRAHGLRKYVLTSLTNAQIDPVVRRMLLGHDIGLDQNYYKPAENHVLQEYLKAVDLLTINNEHRLQKQVVELKQKQDDIDLMKVEQKMKNQQMLEQMHIYQNKIEEFEDKDKKEKEELRRGLTETMKMIRALVTNGNDDSRAKNKVYYLQPEDAETKEGLKASSVRAFKQLREDTLSAHSYYKHRLAAAATERRTARRKNQDIT